MICVIFSLVFCYYLLSTWNEKSQHQSTSDIRSGGYYSEYGDTARRYKYRNNYLRGMYDYNDEDYQRFRAYRDHRIDMLGRWFFAGLMMAMIIFVLL